MKHTEQELSFSNLSLSPQLSRAVENLNYTNATSIQAQAIPLMLDGHDIIGRSSTGTGKTAAFGIPAIECTNGDVKRPQVLVICPTRELAMQITQQMQLYAKYKEGISIAAVYGGASMSLQIRQLRHANVIVGTPGRLMDHLRRKTLKMDDLKMVVLDEADEMLSMGFIEDIQTILSQAPAERQTVLFSATMPPAVLKISEEFLTEPHVVDVMSEHNNKANIEQTFYYVAQNNKADALQLLLQFNEACRSIVFCNTKSMVDTLAARLSESGLRATGLHGDMTQALRTQVMHNFRTGSVNILVATDVAARGIDVDNVDAVINFDIPQSFEYYIHRIGRTGRAGKAGVSQTLVSNGKQVSTLKALMRFTGDNIAEHRLPTGADMMSRSISKLAEELSEINSTGNAATLLVQQLAEAGKSPEQIALLLAEKLTGGDSRFQLSTDRDARSAPRTRGEVNMYADNASMVNIVADIGRSARITPNHLVGAIAELLDIPGSAIGKIEIRDDSSYIGLREDTALALLNHKKPIRIKGTNVTFVLQKKKGRPSSHPTHKGKRKYTSA